MFNYIQTHWQGKFPLWKAYWINGLLLSMAAGAIVGAVAGLVLALSGADVPKEAWEVLGGWLALPITVWGVVGTWRSAIAYQAEVPGRFWGIVAQVMLVIGSLASLARMFGFY